MEFVEACYIGRNQEFVGVSRLPNLINEGTKCFQYNPLPKNSTANLWRDLLSTGSLLHVGFNFGIVC